MQFIAAPILLMAAATGLAPDIAPLGQFLQHLRQFHGALAVQAGIFPGFGRPFPALVPVVASWGSLLFRLTWRALGRAAHRLGSGKMFARLDGRRVAGDVADEAGLLGLPDQGLVGGTRPFPARGLR